jgi:hypothetical protein
VLGFIQALPLEVSPEAVMPQSTPAAATAVDFSAILSSVTSEADLAPQPGIKAPSGGSAFPPAPVANVLIDDLTDAIEPAPHPDTAVPTVTVTAPHNSEAELQPSQEPEQPEEIEQPAIPVPVQTWTQQPVTPPPILGWITPESGHAELEEVETKTVAPETGQRPKSQVSVSHSFQPPEIAQPPKPARESQALAPVDASAFVPNPIAVPHGEPVRLRPGAAELHRPVADIKASEQPSPETKKLVVEPVAFQAVIRPSDSDVAAAAPEQAFQQSTPPAPPRRSEPAPNPLVNELPHSEAPAPKAERSTEVVPDIKPAPVPAGSSSTHTVERPAAPAAPAPVTQTLPQDRPSTTEPVRNVSIRLEAPEADPVHVRMTDRGGSIHVAVHTPGPDLARNLGDRLPELVQQLDRSGYSAHVWKPEHAAETVHRISSGFESSVNSGGTGSNADPRSYGEQTGSGAYSRSAQDSSFGHAGEDRHSRGRQYQQEIYEVRPGRPTPAEAEEIEQWQA